MKVGSLDFTNMKDGAATAANSKFMNIGLTGGIGCGKSTALEYFRQAGAKVLETDAIVRELLSSDPALIAAVVEAFGDEVLDPEGRRKVSRVIRSWPCTWSIRS